MFEAIKNLFKSSKQEQLLNDWNDSNLIYSAMSPRALAANRSACLEMVGKLLCYVAAGDERGQKTIIAYLYRYIFAMLPPGGMVRLPAGLSPDPAYIAQAICADPFEAIAHLSAFAKSRGFTLYECVRDTLGDKSESSPWFENENKGEAA